MTTEEGARIIAQEREIEDLKLQVEELKQERDKYKEKEKAMNNLCGICYKTRSKIREDCIHYHCEHQMGASIDCCLKTGQLGDCPCTDDCKNFISKSDRVVVVRCKNCEYKRPYKEDGETYNYCALEVRPNRNWTVKDTDFCSWGERSK